MERMSSKMDCLGSEGGAATPGFSAAPDVADDGDVNGYASCKSDCRDGEINVALPAGAAGSNGSRATGLGLDCFKALPS